MRPLAHRQYLDKPFISQPWRKIDFSPRLRDKIWVGPGDEASVWSVKHAIVFSVAQHPITVYFVVFIATTKHIREEFFMSINAISRPTQEFLLNNWHN